MTRPFVLACLLALALPLGAHAEEADGPRQWAAAWARATTDAERGAAALRLAASGAAAADVATWIGAARSLPADAETGRVVQWTREAAGKTCTVYANVPASYDPAEPTPVLVWLHGGISRDEDGGGEYGIRNWSEISDEAGFLLLSPSGRAGTEWWTPTGVALLRGALDDLRRRYNVDVDRVCCAGFSDGASGCFHLLVHDAEPFCCFLALMGQPLVSRLMGGPTYVANLASRPVYAVHGGADRLYPVIRLGPIMNELGENGCDLTWKGLGDAGHDLAAVRPLWEEMHAFWKEHPRKKPVEITWQSAAPAVDGRFHWIEILAVDPEAPGDEDVEVGVLTAETRRSPPRLGIRLDTRFEGPGFRIASVSAGSAAEEAGLQAGDVLTAVDGASLETAADQVKLMRALAASAERGEDATFTVRRGEEHLEVKARPRPLVQEPEGPGQGRPAGTIVAELSGPNQIHLKTRAVKRLRLHLGPDLVDLAQPVKVFVNGVVRHDGPVKEDVAYLLTEAHRNAGVPSYRAALVIAP